MREALRRRSTLLVTVTLVALAALVIGATSQAAAAKIIHTDFFIQSGTESRGPHGFEVTVFGRIDSTKRKCVHRRKVKLYFKRNGERRLRDTGLSSRNGAIGLTAQARAAPDRYIVIVTKKRIHRPRRPYTCWRAHDGHKPFRFTPPPPPPP
jgi:hypothetical protein